MTCKRCKATCDGYGCPRCVRKLRAMLAELPWWLNELEFTATGQARMGETVRRTPRYRKPLNGDSSPLVPYPADEYPSDAHAHEDRKQAVLRDALARGRVNARASELAEKVYAVLVEWVRDLCETQGIDLPTFDEPRRGVAEVGVVPGDPTPWVDASTVHVAAGDPGEYCEECWMRHRGGCA